MEAIRGDVSRSTSVLLGRTVPAVLFSSSLISILDVPPSFYRGLKHGTPRKALLPSAYQTKILRWESSQQRCVAASAVPQYHKTKAGSNAARPAMKPVTTLPPTSREGKRLPGLPGAAGCYVCPEDGHCAD